MEDALGDHPGGVGGVLDFGGEPELAGSAGAGAAGHREALRRIVAGVARGTEDGY